MQWLGVSDIDIVVGVCERARLDFDVIVEQPSAEWRYKVVKVRSPNGFDVSLEGPKEGQHRQLACVVRLCDDEGLACASVQEATLSRVSEEAARAASSALAMVDTAERLLDRDLEASDDAGVAASRE